MSSSSDPNSVSPAPPAPTQASTALYNGTAANHTSAVASSSSGDAAAAANSSNLTPQVLDKRRLQELVKEVDPHEQLDEDVEELLMHIADDFIEQTVSQAAQLAKHRKANTIDVRDVQLVLERNWNMWIPGFGTEEIRSHKRSATTESHKSRMALIRKTLKKY